MEGERPQDVVQRAPPAERSRMRPVLCRVLLTGALFWGRVCPAEVEQAVVAVGAAPASAGAALEEPVWSHAAQLGGLGGLGGVFGAQLLNVRPEEAV